MTNRISPLRQRMVEDMNARQLGPHSQRSHIYSCERFASFLKRSLDTATADDVRRFQLHSMASGASIGNRNRIMTGVKFLLRVTLRRLDLAAEIYHLKEPQRLPLVMSPEEAKRLPAMAGTSRSALLALGYGCGLRAGEVIRLRVGDIDSAQNIIRVVPAKGRKDRHVMLPPEVLGLLRQWWKERPTRHDKGVPPEQRWLFPGGRPRSPMTTRQLSRLFHETAKAAALQAGNGAFAPPQLRDPPPGARHRHPHHPGPARSSQARYDGALHTRRHWHDRPHREPAPPAVQAT